MAAGRRTSLASLAGQKVDDVPGRSDPLLLTLPLSQMVPTRFNPRRNFGAPADLEEFGLKLKKRQLQPAVVVSRAAYLKLWPDEADNVGSVPYVIANGERRYRGSLAVGLTTLNVVHNEDVAKSRADFLDAVLSENVDREDLDPIERAIGIETMVEQLGGADQVAAHYGKSKGWVSQQRKLLRLVPELQALVSSGELAIRVAREIAGLAEADQVPAWEAELERRRAAESTPRAARARKAEVPPTIVSPRSADTGERFTAVNQSQSSSVSTGDAAERFTAVNRGAEPAPLGAVPGGTEEVSTSTAQAGSAPPDDQAGWPNGYIPRPQKMPWADGVASMDIIFAKLEPTERRKAIARYLELLGSAEAFVEDLTAASTPQYRDQVAELLLSS
ncbi:ParB/RepB/Spo0J family partition protein [Streptomyces goshikiensis]|uniref:ParB/RepB/Spo0J family partition protein n=1 Tax=Streptomyces goshikiensis TaxID=1942 RepID=UPI0036544B51